MIIPPNDLSGVRRVPPVKIKNKVLASAKPKVKHRIYADPVEQDKTGVVRFSLNQPADSNSEALQ
jgi:hypothetical protein